MLVGRLNGLAGAVIMRPAHSKSRHQLERQTDRQEAEGSWMVVLDCNMQALGIHL